MHWALDKTRSNKNPGTNAKMNTTDFDPRGNDPSPVIGASLLPFLPPGRNETRRPDRADEAIGNDFHSGSSKRRRDASGDFRDQFHVEDDIDDDQACTSLLLHGGVSTLSDTDRNLPQEGNQQRRRTRTRNRILLRGPPGSGKTSLAMNLAYSEAKKDSHLSSGVSAIVYRAGPSENSATTGDASDRFPLFCRRLQQHSAAPSSIHTEMSKSSAKEGASAMVNEKERQQEEEESWDPETLRRIQICRVSSTRQLWEDLLVLAGKPLDEQPTRSIIIEDLDKLIESEGTPRNQIGNRSGKNTKHHHVVAKILKTVALAADTALMGKAQLEYPSRPHSLRLLVTLTTIDSLQQQGDSSTHRRRGVALNGTDSSDFLAVASCIDTVATLSERPQNIEHRSIGNNRNIENRDLVWQVPKSTMNRGSDSTTKNYISTSNLSANETETIVVNSLWRAKIYERESLQYGQNCHDKLDGGTSDEVLIDYAFVESLPKDEEDQQHGILGLREFDGTKELRWKPKFVVCRKLTKKHDLEYSAPVSVIDIDRRVTEAPTKTPKATKAPKASKTTSNYAPSLSSAPSAKPSTSVEPSAFPSDVASSKPSMQPSLNPSAEELGRDFSIHYYMPTSMGFDAYENHDANTRIQWAAQNNEQLDIRGHSWSSWLQWRACGDAPSKCSNVDLTTYAPATVWDNWGESFYDMYDFKGNDIVVYGSKDFLSIPSLSAVLGNTGSLGNIEFDRLPGTGHKLVDILQAHNP